MTINPENLVLIASAYVAAIGLIAWQSRARQLGAGRSGSLPWKLGSIYLNLLLHQNPSDEGEALL